MLIGKQGRTVVNMDFEFAILNYIQTLRFGGLDACMLFVSQLVDKGLLWLALVAVLLAARRTRRVAAAFRQTKISATANSAALPRSTVRSLA